MKENVFGIVAGRPSLALAGRRLTVFYSETFPADLHRRNLQMADAGAEVFMLIVRGGWENDYHTTWFWRDEGVFGDETGRSDGLAIEDQARAVLEKKPDAVFMVRWASEVPLGWAGKHPDELQTGEKGRRRESSYASRLAAEGRAEMARRIVRFVESRPWGSRVIGYMAFGQDEGTTNLAIQDSLFDLSPAMQREFRRFLSETYGTDEALREAWGDNSVRIATARVPTESEWNRARESGWLHWPDPSLTGRYRDYFLAVRRMLFFQRRTELRAIREAASRPVLTATDALKQPMLGWLIEDAFEAKARGMEYRNILLASGSIGVGPLLDAPELDALITPADYTARSVGFGWESEGIADSLRLRGKMILIEDDARSWATDERGTQGAWRSVAECRAGLLRNLAVAASRGHLPYWMNVGQGYFDDPEVLRIVKEQIPLRKLLLTRPWEETEHAIAMIIDDESPLDEDFTSGFQNLAVLRQRNDHLALTGLPYRVYLFSDLERHDFPLYRMFLFPNLFRLTEERLALIKRRLMRDGRMLVFGPGTGVSDGKRLGPEKAAELMGFPLELVAKAAARRVLAYGGTHPALSGVRGPFVYGDSHAYGPILQPPEFPRKFGAVELGRASVWWHCNRPGLVLKDHGRGASGPFPGSERGEGDCAVVFSMAVPLPACLLRSLALHAGCVPWSDEGDVVAANANMIAVHSARPGKRLLRLPRRVRITDALTGGVLNECCDSFEIELCSPDTRVFLMDDPA